MFSINQLIFAICRGGWPRSLMGKSALSQLEIANDLFYQTCNVDVSNIDHVNGNPLIAEKIIRSYARNICTLASVKTIYGDVCTTTDISKPTYYSYIDALKARENILHEDYLLKERITKAEQKIIKLNEKNKLKTKMNAKTNPK